MVIELIRTGRPRHRNRKQEADYQRDRRERERLLGIQELRGMRISTTERAMLDELKPRASGRYADQITFVKDRPGHDRRYAIDARKIEAELGWTPAETFETGIRKTVAWYLAHQDWLDNVTSGSYRHWIDTHYAKGN